MYILMRTDKHHREDKYLQYLLSDPVSDYQSVINKQFNKNRYY